MMGPAGNEKQLVIVAQFELTEYLDLTEDIQKETLKNELTSDDWTARENKSNARVSFSRSSIISLAGSKENLLLI